MYGSGLQSGSGISDLVQDLYLRLFRKGRFTLYLAKGMTDHQIEREILNLELNNLLIGSLRRERPEHYRLARRVARVLEMDPRFRRSGAGVVNGAGGFGRAAERLYGLVAWEAAKREGLCEHAERSIEHIAVPQRDLRRRGAGGGSQVIISTSDLAILLEEILGALGSPTTLRVLRQLALTRLSLTDPVLTSLDETEAVEWGRADSALPRRILAVDNVTPELLLIGREQQSRAREMAERFLERLAAMVRHDSRRKERLLQVAWHLYFDPERPTQLEIARMVGISDSSVSDYRRRLEKELGAIPIEVEYCPDFIEALGEGLSQARGRDLPLRPTSAPEAFPEQWLVSADYRITRPGFPVAAL